MNDQDYIRKAVELAGWSTTRLGNQRVAVFIPSDECDKGMLLRIGYLDQPHILDALAAQLVRQVDQALCALDWGQLSKPFYKENGPDRTMNTIKATVDSKVLKGIT